MSEPTPERASDKPMVQMLVSMSGASAPEHETDPPGVEDASLKAGHEPDRFQVKGILYVPAAVVVLLIFAYTCITSIFGALRARDARADAAANPITKAINDETINKRFSRISSTDEKAPVKQPRLEMLRETKEPNTEEDPAFYRTKQWVPTPGVNPPEITPQDLRPERYVDPATGQRILVERAPVGKPGSGLVRIPIAQAIKLLSSPKHEEHDHDLMDKFVPVQKNPVKLPTTNVDTAKISTGGTGGPSDPRPEPAKPTEKPKDAHGH